MVWHYVSVPLLAAVPHSRLASPLRFAWSGVDLFFVLSGFLIGGILLDHRESSAYFRAFYARRACRILPLYTLWVALFFVIVAAWGGRLGATQLAELFAPALPWWRYVTFTQNFAMAAARDFGARWLGITWSLAIEEQFYLFLPLLVRFLPRRAIPWVLGALAAAAPLLRLALDPSGRGLAMMLPFCRADSLMLGALCAWLVRRPDARAWLAERRSWLYALLVLQLAVVVALGASRTIFEASPGASYFSRFALLYVTLLLIAVSETTGPARAVLEWSWLRRLGGIAYCVYLTHVAVLALVHVAVLGEAPGRFSAAAMGVALVAFALTCVLGALSWRFVEGPMIALGHRVGYERTSGGTRSEVAAEAPARSVT